MGWIWKLRPCNQKSVHEELVRSSRSKAVMFSELKGAVRRRHPDLHDCTSCIFPADFDRAWDSALRRAGDFRGNMTCSQVLANWHLIDWEDEPLEDTAGRTVEGPWSFHSKLKRFLESVVGCRYISEDSLPRLSNSGYRGHAEFHQLWEGHFESPFTDDHAHCGVASQCPLRVTVRAGYLQMQMYAYYTCRYVRDMTGSSTMTTAPSITSQPSCQDTTSKYLPPM